MAYRLSGQATLDLDHLYVQGAERFGLDRADRYHDSLERCFAFLSDQPHAARQRREITPPVRAHPHGSHIIIYRVDDDTRDVLILRVRHMHEDWERNPL